MAFNGFGYFLQCLIYSFARAKTTRYIWNGYAIIAI